LVWFSDATAQSSDKTLLELELDVTGLTRKTLMLVPHMSLAINELSPLMMMIIEDS
jgi:hypothetical protein